MAKKGIPLIAKKMKQEIFLNVYAGLMKENRIWMQFICYFYEGSLVSIQNCYIRIFYEENSCINVDKKDPNRV